MAAKHFHLWVPFLIPSIERHNQLVDHTINLIVTKYGGEEIGGGYETFADPEKDPGKGHEEHSADECAACAAMWTLPGREMEFAFADKDQAEAAARAAELLMDVIGCTVTECTEDERAGVDEEGRKPGELLN